MPKAVIASMCEGANSDAQGRLGASELVDPIDSAIAATSDYGIDLKWDCIPNPIYFQLAVGHREMNLMKSPAPEVFSGRVAMAENSRLAIQSERNRGKPINEHFRILQAYVCMDSGVVPRPVHPPKILIQRDETGDEARLRWQKKSVPRSFHGAIYGGKKNHSQVTAYDVAIGGGFAPTHPKFYGYLCAVADWRLKKLNGVDKIRPGILEWEKFLEKYSVYWKDEPDWRRALIEGNVKYYSSGELPTCLPLFPEGLPPAVVSETLGQRVVIKETR